MRKKDYSKILKPLIAFVITLSMASCSDRPKNVATDSEMIKIMADMEMAQAYLQKRGYREQTGKNKEQILEYVLEKNGMTRANFDSTISWYGRHIDKYDDLYAKVDKELARRESKISGNAVEVLSNDLWPYSRHLVISPKSSTDNFYFSIPASDLQKGDKLTLKFNLSVPVEGKIVFGVSYNDGLVSYVSTNSNGKDNELTVQTDTSKIVKDIFGNLHLKNNRITVGIDSLMLYSTPFDSIEYYKLNIQKRFNLWHKKNLETLRKDTLSL